MKRILPSSPKPSRCFVLAVLLMSISASPRTLAQSQKNPAAVGKTEGDYVIENFRFKDGAVLPELRLHYLTLGSPHRDASGSIDNAALLLHSTASDTTEFLDPEFSEPLFETGTLLDLSRFYIIIPDAIGHGKSSKPSDGLRGHFPHYEYEDMVSAQYRLVREKLGVTHLRLVMGLSMGGMHTWLWGERYPNMMDALMPISALPVQIAGRNRLWRRMVIEAIRNDPDWKNGDYEQQPHGYARIVPLIAMMVSSPMRLYEKYPTRASADAYYDHILQIAATKDANDRLYQYDSSRNYDPAPDLGKIKAKVLLIVFADDQINSPEFGALDREMPHVKNGRFVVVPAGRDSNGEGNNTNSKLWRVYLEELLGLAKRKPGLSVVPEDELQTSGENSKPEMQKLADVLAGRWSGTLTTEPGSREVGRADEIWHVTPGGLTLTEENHLRTSKGDSYDFATIWWKSKAKKYEGIWCAEINDEGCNGFQASLESNQVIMRGEWEQSGKRRAWKEVFSRLNQSEFIQTLDLGEIGGEMKRVSAIHASRTQDSTDDPGIAKGAGQELRNAMDERHKAMIAGDTATVERLTADEYVQTDISGYVQDKSTWLNEYFRPIATLIKAGKFRWDTYEEKEVQIHMFGNTAVVTGSMALKGTGAKPSGHTLVESPETTFTGTLRFTRVWVKRNGSWRLAALQNALMQPRNDDRNNAGRDAESHGNSEAAKLVALTNEWTDAINIGNRQKLDVLMASDFALYHWNGQLGATRAQWLDNLFNHIKITKNTLTDAAPQVYGDFGVVTSVGDWVGTFDSKAFSQKCIVVDTWAKSDSRWKVVRRTSHCYTEDAASGKVTWNF